MVAGGYHMASLKEARAMRLVRRLLLALLLLAIPPLGATPSHASPEGQMTWAVHFSLAPTWFDPAETSGIITPFVVLYALHDAMVKPLPGNPMAPSLAESWSASTDWLVYEFVLRKGVRFHNGEPVTAEDVKFSLERYRGASNRMLKDRVLAIETPDPGRVRIRLKQPWPDFMTFYSIATGAGWIVPKKYVEKVGEDGFQKATIGACVWPRTTPSIGRRSTRRRTWDTRRSRGASSPRASTSTGSRRRTRTIPPGPGSSWRRQATRTASTRATTSSTRRS